MHFNELSISQQAQHFPTMATTKLGTSSTALIQTEYPEDDDVLSSEESEEEKDETELELEKLVFGDDAGFREALKSQAGEELDSSDGDSSDRDGGDIGEEADEAGLDGIEDEAVRTSNFHEMHFYLVQRLTFRSFFS
jgi:hypothetical protein